MLTIRGRSLRTVEAYYTDLRVFLRYIRSTKDKKYLTIPINQIPIADIPFTDIESITLTDVYSFLMYSSTSRENSARTRSRKVSSIRSFFKYLTSTSNLLQENPVKDLETPNIKKSISKYLSLDESVELLTNVKTSYTERDYCMITLFLNTGMRLSELVGLDTTDIRENSLRILGKGNKERIVYLNKASEDAILEYLKVRVNPTRATEKNALFISGQSRRLSPRRVQQIVGECLKTAGLGGQGYSPHKLRHTAATLLYQHGQVDLRVLQEILGHSSLATTEIYTHVANKQVKEAAGKSPLAKVVRTPKTVAEESKEK